MLNMTSKIKACFSSKLKYSAIIRYLIFKGKAGTEINNELTYIYGSSVLSYPQV